MTIMKYARSYFSTWWCDSITKTFVFLTCFIDNILLGQVFLINNNFKNVFSMLIIFFRKFWYWKWLLFVKPGNIMTYLWPNKVNFSNKKNVCGFIMSILPIEDLFYRICKWFSIGLTLSPKLFLVPKLFKFYDMHPK